MSFVATLVRSAKSSSSKKWLGRQFRDPLVKQRASHPSHYRSRSAFKLIDLDSKYKFFKFDDVRSVVDLGAAPGGWSQVVAGKMGWVTEDVVGSRGLKAKKLEEQAEDLDAGFGLADDARSASYGSWSTPSDADSCDTDITPPSSQGRANIVAVDLLPIPPIPGVKTLQMDFLSPQADTYINALLTDDEHGGRVGKADVILSDMAANFSGNRLHDVESSLRICEAVFEFTKRHMRTAHEIGRLRGGVLVYVRISPTTNSSDIRSA